MRAVVHDTYGSPDVPAFSGFPGAAFEFFERVQPDIDWATVLGWQPDWEAAVHLPTEALLAALAPEFSDGYAYHLHRDPWLWRHQVGVVSVADTVALRAILSVDGLLAEGGWLRSDSAQVGRYQQAVLAEASGHRLAEVTAALRVAGFELTGKTLVRAPAGFGDGHPRAALGRHRTLMASAWIEPHLLAGPACLDAVRGSWRALRPLTSWLAANVGPRAGHGT